MNINPYIFRQYDIRGVVDKDLTPEVVELIGKGFATYVKRRGAKKVSVGGDIRIHTERLRDFLINGIISTGVDVINLGPVPTPVQYFSLHKLPVDGGVQITGSHNPPEFNGFKMSLGKASIYGDMIQEIKELILNNDFEQGAGKVEMYDIKNDYINDVLSRVKLHRNVKVISDCGNGAAGLVATEILKKLGVELTELYTEPDGTFPNHHPDPTVEEYIQDLIGLMKKGDAEIGVAFDGDADRLGVVDEKGNIIWGDKLMIIFARDLLSRQPGASVIFDVKCSQALSEEIEKAGGKPVMWKTGHSLLKEKMRESGAPLAGEMSGHLFFKENWYGFDDAIYAAVRLIEILSRSEKSLSEMLADVPVYYSTPEMRLECPTDEEKFKITTKAVEYFKENYQVIDVDGVRILFGDGWGLVRASNTQPVIVARFEARSPERLEELKNLVLSKLSEFGEISW